MRATMLQESKPVAAVFVGGMEGIEEEWDAFGQRCPGKPRLAMVGPGRGAARLPVDDAVPVSLQREFQTQRYPVAAFRLVEFLIQSQLG